MIDVTERAIQELKKILSAKADLPQARLRLTSSEQGKLGLGIDIDMPGDRVVEYKGLKVLCVEEALADSLNGVVLDVEETNDGPQLVICGEW